MQKSHILTKKNRYAFTLVELIVVITILVVLGTIGFSTLSGHSLSARDSKRIYALSSLHEGLSFLLISAATYPMPENPITLTASGTIVGYQGFAKEQIESMIKLSPGATKDPLDPTIYTTYSVSANQAKMQLMAFLEDGSTATTYIPGIMQAFASINSNYTKRIPTSKGDAFGILLGNTGTTLNQPVQERYSVGSFTGVDVVNTSTGYTVFFSKGDTINGTGIVLASVANMGAKSCNDLLQKDSDKKKQDGTYYINPTGTGSFLVYCDMTTDGGGWTRVFFQNHANTINTASINLLSSVRPYSFSLNQFEEVPKIGFAPGEAMVHMSVNNLVLKSKFNITIQPIKDFFKDGTTPGALSNLTGLTFATTGTDVINNTNFAGTLNFYRAGAIFGEWAGDGGTIEMCGGQWWMSNDDSNANMRFAYVIPNALASDFSSIFIR